MGKRIPLVNCVADTQGGIGYQIQQALTNEFAKRRINKKVATVITQVEVSIGDPNFKNPTKPVGSFFTIEQAEEMKKGTSLLGFLLRILDMDIEEWSHLQNRLISLKKMRINP